MPRKRVLFGVVVASLALTAAGGKAQHPPHWGYAGEEGPSHWAKLAPEYGSCAGKQQSPVDLDRFSDVELPRLAPHYKGAAKDILNNGHTVQVDFAPGSTLTIDNIEFTLKQVHVHLPSEHTLHGKSFPMEAHLVHADASGHLVVVAVLFEAGTPNAQVAHLLKQAPAHAGAPMPLPATEDVVASALLPRNLDYFRYSGSLTTPPCTEGVRWIVLRHPVQASNAQMHALATVLGHPNNRPVQPIGARRILE